jgi:LmbE family N-acetylglucosaminyl deacetylase
MPDHSLLAIFAHPDDETFGLAGCFAMYRSRGIRCALITASCGEAGEISDLVHINPEDLCDARADELKQAMKAVGVDEVNILGYADGRVSQADPQEITGRIVRLVRQMRPDVIVTFGPEGIYGHPDHIAIHKYGTRAFHEAAQANSFPEQLEQGLSVHTTRKLYYNVVQRSRFKKMAQEAAQAGEQYHFPIDDLDKFGVEDDRVTTIIDVRPYFDQKWEAIWSHKSQLAAGSPFRVLPKEVLREALGIETFQRAIPPPSPGEPVETDLFAGLK